MSKTGTGIVEYAKSKIGTPYVYGMKMQVMTLAKYNELKKLYGKYVWDSDKSKVGKVCCDCSGLISAYTGIVQGSSQMKDTAKECHPINTIKDAPIGALVWQQGHVGIYSGMENGVPYYIAEDGSAYGCRKNKLSNAKFTHWLLMSYIDYSTPAQKPITKEEEEVITKISVVINGKKTEVEAINKNGYNFVKLRDLESAKIAIGYKNNLPTITTE